jgi:hypothetical protein
MASPAASTEPTGPGRLRPARRDEEGRRLRFRQPRRRATGPTTLFRRTLGSPGRGAEPAFP